MLLKGENLQGDLNFWFCRGLSPIFSFIFTLLLGAAVYFGLRPWIWVFGLYVAIIHEKLRGSLNEGLYCFRLHSGSAWTRSFILSL